MFDDTLKSEKILFQIMIDLILNLKSHDSPSDLLVLMFYKLTCDHCYIMDRIGLLKEMEKNFKLLFLVKTKNTMIIRLLLSLYFVSVITFIG